MKGKKKWLTLVAAVLLAGATLPLGAPPLVALQHVAQALAGVLAGM